MNDSLLILGAGGHGRSIYELAILSGSFTEVHFLDDSINENNYVQSKTLGTIDQLSVHALQYTHALVGIGNNKVRQELQQKIRESGLKLPALIHPAAIVSSSAKIGAGSVIFAGCVIGVDVCIGEGVIVNCQSVVDHDGILEDFSHLGVGVKLAGNSFIGRHAFVQAGSCGGYNSNLEPFATCIPGTVLKTRA